MKNWEGKYRIQVWVNLEWRWGLHDYTYEQATQRLHQLKGVGIKARIKPSAELFS